ncbi:MAG: NAD(P)-dependent oxidoreductase, partial [Planctomycetes bacterium]|nr:NAD(P)-dependent oxidoreductase [Planctomycetota bacterium]
PDRHRHGCPAAGGQGGSEGRPERTAVVTGAAGFLGSRMCRYLLAAGWRVAAVVRPGRADALPADLRRRLAAVVAADGVRELADGFSALRSEVVFHFATRYTGADGGEDLPALVRDNILFGTSVLEAMRRSGVRLFVTAGTAWQNSIADSPEYAPANLYAASKQAFESLLRHYQDDGSIAAVSLRIFDTYGEGDPRPKVLNLLLRTLAEGGRLDLSPGEQELDLVHVDDICRAFHQSAGLLLAGGQLRPVYGLSSGRPVTLRQVATLLERVAGARLAVTWGGRPYRRREVMRVQRTYPVLPHWQPQVSLEDGLRRLWAYSRAAGAASQG